MRTELTEPERVLGDALRRRQTGGMRFRRQRVIGPYIVDFCSLGHKQVVEVDGAHHRSSVYREFDVDRSRYLEARGFRGMRFDNAEILKDVERVVRQIASCPPLPGDEYDL